MTRLGVGGGHLLCDALWCYVFGKVMYVYDQYMTSCRCSTDFGDLMGCVCEWPAYGKATCYVMLCAACVVVCLARPYICAAM